MVESFQINVATFLHPQLLKAQKIKRTRGVCSIGLILAIVEMQDDSI